MVEPSGAKWDQNHSFSQPASSSRWMVYYSYNVDGAVFSVPRCFDRFVHKCLTAVSEIYFLLVNVKLQLLCSSCRVRPLSESLNDLFREVALLRRRITELSQRLATLEPFLRHYGYRKEEEEEKEEKEEAGGGRAQGVRGEEASQVRYSRRPGPPRGSGVVRRRGRVLKNGVVGRVHRASDSHWERKGGEGRVMTTERYSANIKQHFNERNAF